MSNDMQCSAEMPRYKCHKEVWALQIESVSGSTLKFVDNFSDIVVDPIMFARYIPKPGDYYVVYRDGYKSFSPQQVFEEGYTRMPQ